VDVTNAIQAAMALNQALEYFIDDKKVRPHYCHWGFQDDCFSITCEYDGDLWNRNSTVSIIVAGDKFELKGTRKFSKTRQVDRTLFLVLEIENFKLKKVG